MATLFINEFHYDNDGTDTGEFVELAGEAGLDLTPYSLVFYNGANGTEYRTETLTGVLGDDTGTGWGFSVVDLPTNGIQNGAPDGIALFGNGSVLQFLSYEGSFMANGGVADGLTSTDIGVAESSATAAGLSLQLTGFGDESADFTWSGPMTATAGAVNLDQQFALLDTPAVPLPAALPLLMVGLAALAGLRRRVA